MKSKALTCFTGFFNKILNIVSLAFSFKIKASSPNIKIKKIYIMPPHPCLKTDMSTIFLQNASRIEAKKILKSTKLHTVVYFGTLPCPFKVLDKECNSFILSLDTQSSPLNILFISVVTLLQFCSTSFPYQAFLLYLPF